MLGPGVFHVLFLTLAAVVTAGLSVYAWRHREEPGAESLSAAMVSVTGWTVTEIFALSETGASHLVWEQVQWTAIAVAPLFFFLFMAEFTGYEWVRSRRYAPILFVIPVLTVLLAWTNPAHHLMWSDPVHIETGGIVTIDLAFGPWFWLYFVYAYGLLLVGFVLLLRLVTVSNYLYLDQTVLIVVGILAPLLGNALAVFDISPLPGLDLTPYGFTVTAVAFGNALFRYRLFDLLPATRRLGRQAALVGLDDGIVIVDTDRKLLYLNPAAGEIFDRDPDEVLGDPVDSLVDAGELDFGATDRVAELAVGRRTYEVETAPISDRRGKHVGHTILLYDVTERTRREQELRVQRDRFRRLELINTIIRDVNQTLISVDTVEELRRQVVETLATPGLYDDVWLSTTADEGPPLRMTADDDAPAPADDDAPAHAEGFQADAETVDSPERVPAAVEQSGEGEWATVAIVYGRTVYGALAIHTSRDAGFGERELDVLDELGETVGHALTAIERTRLLVADTRLEVELQSSTSDDLLVRLSEATAAEWTLTGLVPAAEGTLVTYLDTDAAVSPETVAAHPGVTDVRRLASDGGTTFEVRTTEGLLAHPLVDAGANVVSASASDGRCRLTAELSPDASVRTTLERIRESFPGTELLARREVEPTDRAALPGDADLTDRQREALEAAYRAGYFDWPRESTAEDVARSLDIAAATLHGHLRKAENRLLDEFFEEDSP